MLKISVIVPVYNVEPFLDECLDSLERQTYGNVEVVCVDDGSTDSSGAMLDERALRTAGMRVIHQANAGLSAARNAGMRAATGDVLMFLDSDDWYADNACALVAGVFERAGAEAVVFGAQCVPAELANPHAVELLSPRCATYNGYSPDLLFKENSKPYAVRVALSRAFAEREGIRFDESLRYAEDQAFCFTVYPLSRKTVLVSEKPYFYRMREASLVHEQGKSGAEADRLGRHLEAVEAILAEWGARGLLEPGFRRENAGPFTTWCLDLVLFDLMRLDETGQRAFCGRVAGALSRAFGARFWNAPEKGAARAAAKRVAEGKGFAGAAGKLAAARFFAGERGVAQCVRKVLGS